jgi:hypothetical protein
MFFSNLSSASVLSPNLVQVFLTATGSKLAISTSIFFVFSFTPLSNQPTTQANARILFLSAITMSLDFKICLVSNKSTNISPSFAFLTIISPSTLSASKKCIGCHVVIINKLEKSTRLFLGLDHRSSICNLVKNQDGFIFTFFISIKRYVFKPSVSLMTFLSIFLLLSKISKIFTSLNCL